MSIVKGDAEKAALNTSDGTPGEQRPQPGAQMGDDEMTRLGFAPRTGTEQFRPRTVRFVTVVVQPIRQDETERRITGLGLDFTQQPEEFRPNHSMTAGVNCRANSGKSIR